MEIISRITSLDRLHKVPQVVIQVFTGEKNIQDLTPEQAALYGMLVVLSNSQSSAAVNNKSASPEDFLLLVLTEDAKTKIWTEANT